MMYSVPTFCTYKGERPFKTKDGRDSVIYKFINDEQKEFEMMVVGDFNPPSIDTLVTARFIFGDKWNESLQKYEKKYFFKNVVPADV